MMAGWRNVRQGDWSVRAARNRLPAEIHSAGPRVQRDGGQLAERERELVATNERLTVIASIDMLSGLANRRGFQSRLDFEWMKAQQYDSELSLLMIDVDHFKLFNDITPSRGDVCLSRLGERCPSCAETMGFAGRYGARILPAAAEHRRRPRAGRSARWCGRRSRTSRCLTPPASIKPSPSASASPTPSRMQHNSRAT